MRKQLFAVILFSVFFAVSVSAQEPPETAPDFNATISADYNLSYINFSTKSGEAQSILTWRDMYLHGAKIDVEFSITGAALNIINMGMGFAGSFHGYWTDDDTNNDLDIIGASESKIHVFDLNFSLGNRNPNSGLTKRLGLDVSWLGFQNHDFRTFSYGAVSFADIDGQVASYNQFMYGLYGDINARLIATSFFYADLGGKAGLTLGIGEANWMRRSDLEHPVSFRSVGLFLRAGGITEIGFTLRMFTFFVNLQADYEISPWLSGLETFYKDGRTHSQGLYQELSRASCSLGLKASF
jgi:hypothetical protein